MRRSIGKWLFIFCCLSIPLSSIGCSTCGVDNEKDWSFPLQGGFYAISPGRSQDVAIEGLIASHISVTSNLQFSGLAGFGVYYKGLSQENFQLSYGVNIFYLGRTSVTGEIVPELLFDSLAYKYDLQHLPLYIATHGLIYTDSPTFDIAFDLGIGPNALVISGYKETLLNYYTLADYKFKRTTKITASATAGIGLRVNNIQNRMPVECGYRFFYLGQGSLAKRSNGIFNNLSTGNLYANALLCSVTF